MKINLSFTDEATGNLGKISYLPWSLSLKLILVDSPIRLQSCLNGGVGSHEQHHFPLCNVEPCSQ